MPEKKPEFVVEGSFIDHEWREAAATPEGKRSNAQKAAFAAGVRQHPFGPNAYRAEGSDGIARWYTDEETFNRVGDKVATPSPSEGSGPEQAKASRTALDSAEKVQASGPPNNQKGRTRGI